mmetsp:Transcript_19778/g.37160  ORF Transcript_19778/g.37160 Transcript_19778/m.37160 type:complete len:207 (+) Transcript_19778:3103-3723(+)
MACLCCGVRTLFMTSSPPPGRMENIFPIALFMCRSIFVVVVFIGERAAPLPPPVLSPSPAAPSEPSPSTDVSRARVLSSSATHCLCLDFAFASTLAASQRFFHRCSSFSWKALPSFSADCSEFSCSVRFPSRICLASASARSACATRDPKAEFHEPRTLAPSFLFSTAVVGLLSNWDLRPSAKVSIAEAIPSLKATTCFNVLSLPS